MRLMTCVAIKGTFPDCTCNGHVRSAPLYFFAWIVYRVAGVAFDVACPKGTLFDCTFICRAYSVVRFGLHRLLCCLGPLYAACDVACQRNFPGFYL